VLFLLRLQELEFQASARELEIHVQVLQKNARELEIQVELLQTHARELEIQVELLQTQTPRRELHRLPRAVRKRRNNNINVQD
jgi:hypothetical protein